MLIILQLKMLLKNTTRQLITNDVILNFSINSDSKCSNNGSFKVYLSDDSENFGGVSFYPDPIGNKSDSYISCKVSNINEVIEELNIESIDLIKIDTESAEHDILMALQEKIIRNTSWITGELHGNKDFELLNYLNNLGFLISMKKNIDNRLFMFHAGKLEIISQLSKRDIKAL